MMNNLNWVQTSDLNLNLLTRGSDDLTYEENINVHFLYIGGIVDHKLFKLSVSVRFRGHLNNELVYDDFIC
jgi:hypothetical protein